MKVTKLEPSYRFTLESFLSAFGIIVRGFVITFMIFVLIEASLHYRRKPTSLKPYIFQYNFTDNNNQENILVMMS